VKDTRKLLPLSTENNKLVSVSLDIASNNRFQQALASFTSMPQYSNVNKNDESFFNEVLKNVDSTQTVILSVHNINHRLP